MNALNIKYSVPKYLFYCTDCHNNKLNNTNKIKYLNKNNKQHKFVIYKISIILIKYFEVNLYFLSFKSSPT